MRRPVVQATTWWFLCLALGGPAVAGGPPARTDAPVHTGTWPKERIELRDGRLRQGLIESEDDAWVNLIQIEQPPGRPTYLVIRPIERQQIASIDRLGPAQRAQLQERIERFRNRAEIEAMAMDALRLTASSTGGAVHHRYQGRWFLLDSSVEEEITRLLIVRLEQVFTAYRQVLPPRTRSEKPLTVLVFGSLEEYRAYLAKLGLKLANPAVFLRGPNLVVAGTEMARFASEYEKNKAEIQQRELEVRQLQTQLDEGLRTFGQTMRGRGNGGRRIAKVILAERRKGETELQQVLSELKRACRENERLRQQITGRLLRQLYHEAFHAYLENHVYPRDRHAVPLWLDEGLAMIFEEALLDSGSLRLGAPHRTALKRLQEDLAGPRPLTVEQVLAAGPANFLASHGPAAENSNRYYWYAWGLAYYLTFEQHLLAGPALDRYLAADAGALPTVERIESLVGMPIDKFEIVWQKYIRALR